MLRRLAPFLIALAVYGGALLVMHPSPTGDEPHYALEALSIARDGDVDLANQYGDPDLLRDLWGNPSITPHAFAFPGKGDELRSVHSPGLPLLLAPVAAVTTSMFWMRAELVVVAALGALLLMMLLERLPFGSARVRWAAWAAVVLSAPMLVYAVEVYPETPAIVLTLGALVLMTRPRRGPATLAGAATAAALLPWLNVRFLTVTLVLAAVLGWMALRHPRRAAALAAVAGPLALSGLLFAAAFQHWYGSPWPSAQYALSDSPRTLSGAYRYGFGGLFSPAYGWLPFAPVHLLGVVAIGLLVRRLGRPAALGVAGAALYLLVIAASGSGFPGFSFAGRQQLVIVPLIAVPLVALLALRPRWRPVFAVLGVLSLGLTAQAMADHAVPKPPEDGTLRAHYDALWPDYTAQPDGGGANWIAYADRLEHGVGRVVRGGPLPPREKAAVAAPAGARGVLVRGRTDPLPAGAYDFALSLRADRDTGDVAVAALTVRDAGGEVIHRRVITGPQVPPRIGYRQILGSFHTAHAGRVTLTVETTGAAGLRAGGMQVITEAGGSLAGTHGFPGLAKTIAWVLVLLAAGAAVTLIGRGATPRRSGTTPPATAATR